MLALFAFAALAADPSLAQMQADDARVARIAWQIQTANVALCPDVVQLPGFTVQGLVQFPKAARAAIGLALGIGAAPAVAAVVPDSAADRAGLRPNDSIVAIAGAPPPDASLGPVGYAPIARTETMIDDALAKPPLTLKVLRAGRAHAVSIAGDRGCASRVQIVPGRSLNAGADGKYVQINAALLGFAPTDNDLAVLIAHELAHNFLRHQALRTPSKQAEFEADRLGVWLTARAGYDVDAVIPFWTRIEKRTNAGIFADGSHPSSKKRVAAVAKAVAEVKAQRVAAQPLIPPAQ